MSERWKVEMESSDAEAEALASLLEATALKIDQLGKARMEFKLTVSEKE